MTEPEKVFVWATTKQAQRTALLAMLAERGIVEATGEGLSSAWRPTLDDVIEDSNVVVLFVPKWRSDNDLGAVRDILEWADRWHRPVLFVLFRGVDLPEIWAGWSSVRADKKDLNPVADAVSEMLASQRLTGSTA